MEINNKYFVVYNDENHLEEFEMIVLKKAEYKKNKFEFPNGHITKKFPTVVDVKIVFCRIRKL